MPDAGRSLQRQIDDIVDEQALFWIVLIAFVGAFTLVEWLRWYFVLPHMPLALTAAWVSFLLVGVWKLKRLKRIVGDLQLGLQGERWLGQFLQNRLLQKGYWIVHDIQLRDANIDHALIGPTGVYAIETKTRSKRRNEAKVIFDGEQVLVDGWKPDRNPVGQARANARSLSEILRGYSGISVPVRPVVVFPGWYVESPNGQPETWVLNEKAFVKFVDAESDKLPTERVFQLAAALGRYVREQEKQTR